MLELVDTHCHIHAADSRFDGERITSERWQKSNLDKPELLIKNAHAAGVTKLICVGTTLADSQTAVDLAEAQSSVWSSIGIHPHEAKHYVGKSKLLKEYSKLAERPKVVAVGECGLDFYYNHSPKAEQLELLRFQMELALEHQLPMIFHVRDAFEDFWPVFDEFKDISGVVHSFSAHQQQLDQILSRGLYVGLNGIMTFTNDQAQLEAAKAVPQDKLLLETDAPFLTPVPFRGTICQPKHVRVIAEFLADLRQEPLDKLAEVSTANATTLFNLR